MGNCQEIQVVGVLHDSIGMDPLRDYVQENPLALGSVCFIEVINMMPGSPVTKFGCSDDSFVDFYSDLRGHQAPILTVDGCLELNKRGAPFLNEVPKLPQKEFRELLFSKPLKRFLSIDQVLSRQDIRIFRLQNILSRMRDNLIARQVIEMCQDRSAEVVVGASHLPGVVATIRQLCPDTYTSYTYSMHRFFRAYGDWAMSNLDRIDSDSNTDAIAQSAIASSLIQAQAFESSGFLASLLSSIKAPAYQRGEEIEVTDEKVNTTREFMFGKRYSRRRHTPWLVIFDLMRNK